MNAEQIDMRAELDHVKEERDKVQKQLDKSSYLYSQHNQVS